MSSLSVFFWLQVPQRVCKLLMSLLPPRARGMIRSIVSWVSSLVCPQLWHWYLLRSNTYFLTSGGIGILGVLVMNSSVDFLE